MAVCGSLMLYPDSIKESRDPAKVGRYFDFLYFIIIVIKILLPDIYSESIDLIIDCIVLSALFTPYYSVCRLIDNHFQFSLLFINYSNKHQHIKKLWLETIFFVYSYCHCLNSDQFTGDFSNIKDAKI